VSEKALGGNGDNGAHAEPHTAEPHTTTARNQRDTRKQDRATLELPVLVSDAANKVQGRIRFQSADVSIGGAFLRTDLLFEIGEVLTLQFQLGAGPTARTVRARGRVVRVSRDLTRDHVPGMGVEFVDLSPDDRAAIEARLHR
jgi:c-di-GMP-binding flagellar brake protein YcgR